MQSSICFEISLWNKIYVTFVDDYSRKVFLSSVKSKACIFKEFLKFKSMAGNQCSTIMKIFRSDNGNEYTNSQFEKFLTRRILHQNTAKQKTKEQNGVAERLNHTNNGQGAMFAYRLKSG